MQDFSCYNTFCSAVLDAWINFMAQGVREYLTAATKVTTSRTFFFFFSLQSTAKSNTSLWSIIDLPVEVFLEMWTVSQSVSSGLHCPLHLLLPGQTVVTPKAPRWLKQTKNILWLGIFCWLCFNNGLSSAIHKASSLKWYFLIQESLSFLYERITPADMKFGFLVVTDSNSDKLHSRKKNIKTFNCPQNIAAE